MALDDFIRELNALLPRLAASPLKSQPDLFDDTYSTLVQARRLAIAVRDFTATESK